MAKWQSNLVQNGINWFNRQKPEPEPVDPSLSPAQQKELERSVRRAAQEREVQKYYAGEEQKRQAAQATDEMLLDPAPLNETTLNLERKEARNESPRYLDLEIHELTNMEVLTDKLGTYSNPRMDVQSWQEARQMAAQESKDVTAEMLALGYKRSGNPLTSEQFVIVREGLRDLGRDITNKARTMAELDPHTGKYVAKAHVSPTERNQLLGMVQKFALLDHAFRGTTKEAGRLLNITKMLNRTELDTRMAQQVFDYAGGEETFDMSMDLWLRASDSADLVTQVKIARRIADADIPGALYELARGHQLNAPTTHFRNIAGTLVNMTIEEARQFGDAFFQTALRMDPTPMRIFSAGYAPRVIMPMFRNMMHGFRAGYVDETDAAGLQKLIDANKVPRSMMQDPYSNKVDNFRTPQFVRNALPGNMRDMPLLGAAVDAIGKYYVRGPSFRLLKAVDEFWKAPRYEVSLSRQSKRIALQNAQVKIDQLHQDGITGREFQTKKQEILQEMRQENINLFNDPSEDMRKAATAEAKEMTFQTDVNEHGVLAAVNKMRNADWLATAPTNMKLRLGRYVLYYVQTPGNIFSRALNFEPTVAATRTAMDFSSRDPARVAEAVNRVAMVGGLNYMVWNLRGELEFNEDGTVKNYPTIMGANNTGLPDSTLRRLGIQPYSIRVGNKNWSFKSLEPAGTILAIWLNAQDAYKEMLSSSDPDIVRRAQDFMNTYMVATGDYMLGHGFMQGMADVLRPMFYADGDGVVSGLSSIGIGYLNSLMPGGNIMKQANRGLDELSDKEYEAHLRNYWSGGPWEKISKQVTRNIPYLEDKESIPPAWDYWGKPIKNVPILGPMDTMYDPFYVTETNPITNPNMDKDQWLVYLGERPTLVKNQHSFPVIIDDSGFFRLNKNGTPSERFNLAHLPRAGWARSDLEKAIGDRQNKYVTELLQSKQFNNAPGPKDVKKEMLQAGLTGRVIKQTTIDKMLGSKKFLMRKTLAKAYEDGKRDFLINPKNGRLTAWGRAIEDHMNQAHVTFGDALEDAASNFIGM